MLKVRYVASPGEAQQRDRLMGEMAMIIRNLTARRLIAALAAVLGATFSLPAAAHCDTLDGPVVAAARKALRTGNVDLVLIWVQKKDEVAIRNHFRNTVAVRKHDAQAKALADMYFFETLVRLHRAGEGAAYTGLKPAGEIEPPIAAADKALESGNLDGVAKLVGDRTRAGLERHFKEMMAKKQYDPNDVAAGRAFASAYVEYTHYVERLYDAGETLAPGRVQHEAPGLAHSH